MIIRGYSLLDPIIARRKIAGVFGFGGAGHGSDRLGTGIGRGILRVNLKGHVSLAQNQIVGAVDLPQLEFINSDSPHGNVLDRIIEISLVGLARRNGKQMGRAVQHVLAVHALLDKLVLSLRQPAGGHGAVRSGGQNQRVLTIGIIGIGAVGLLLLYLKGGLQSRIGIQRAYLFNLDFTGIKVVGKGDPYRGGIAVDPRAGGYGHLFGGGIQIIAVRGLGLLHPVIPGHQFARSQDTVNTSGSQCFEGTVLLGRQQVSARILRQLGIILEFRAGQGLHHAGVVQGAALFINLELAVAVVCHILRHIGVVGRLVRSRDLHRLGGSLIASGSGKLPVPIGGSRNQSGKHRHAVGPGGDGVGTAGLVVHRQTVSVIFRILFCGVQGELRSAQRHPCLLGIHLMKPNGDVRLVFHDHRGKLVVCYLDAVPVGNRHIGAIHTLKGLGGGDMSGDGLNLS